MESNMTKPPCPRSCTSAHPHQLMLQTHHSLRNNPNLCPWSIFLNPFEYERNPPICSSSIEYDTFASFYHSTLIIQCNITNRPGLISAWFLAGCHKSTTTGWRFHCICKVLCTMCNGSVIWWSWLVSGWKTQWAHLFISPPPQISGLVRPGTLQSTTLKPNYMSDHLSGTELLVLLMDSQRHLKQHL